MKSSGTSKHVSRHERLIARRERSEARQKVREERTLAEQIALVKNRPGKSERELKRLRKKLTEAKS